MWNKPLFYRLKEEAIKLFEEYVQQESDSSQWDWGTLGNNLLRRN